MKFEVLFLPDAEEDLQDIDRYLSKYYPSTPSKFFNELDRMILLLTERPKKFPFYPDTKDFRKMVVKDFIVLYKIDEERNLVEIHHIYHGSRNIKELLY